MADPEPNARDYPHRYIGTPSRIHNAREPLVKGSACRIIGRRAGGLRIKTPNGLEWVVGTRDVEKRPAIADQSPRER